MSIDNGFWLERWQRGEIGWHLPRVHPKLQKYWPLLRAPKDSSVFVPLCGKTIDLLWLAEHHQHVIACELSEIAVQQFFLAAELTPIVQSHSTHQCYSARNISIYVGDFFQLTPDYLPQTHYVYDRAALIALPPSLRIAYVNHLQTLLPSATSLLISLAYDATKMDGPPFSVNESDVSALWSSNTTITQLDNHEIIDLEPRFSARGLSSLRELVFTLKWQNR